MAFVSQLHDAHHFKLSNHNGSSIGECSRGNSVKKAATANRRGSSVKRLTQNACTMRFPFGRAILNKAATGHLRLGAVNATAALTVPFRRA
jgi:hypothetical protein